MGSKNKITYQKNNNTLIAVIVLVLGLTVAIYLVINRTGSFSNASKPTLINQTPIQNENDLINASRDLDNTDIDSMDTVINQNEAEMASF